MSKWICLAIGYVVGSAIVFAALYYDPALLLVPCFIFDKCS